MPPALVSDSGLTSGWLYRCSPRGQSVAAKIAQMASEPSLTNLWATMIVKKIDRYPFEDALSRSLSGTPAVEAVYFAVDEDRQTVHVYSIVQELGSSNYPGLFEQEEAFERQFEGTSFEFHVISHQGRGANRVAPFGAKLVFSR